VAIRDPEAAVCIATDAYGFITDASEGAPKLLNMSRLQGRNLLLFFPNSHAHLTQRLKLVSRGIDDTEAIPVVLYPRERRRLAMMVTLKARDHDGGVLWRLEYATRAS
jgi:hypothetical protein